ncbi:nitroreductase family protein [Saccharomonospora sp. NB11]|uniref:Acg family FMN-binding oxidoreductase n=1 Tax=Saccharomonospora sp. NB11 TaxID=1642298 RepID=UPI0018D14DA6|nr:nitroreductase family protein [Saccharomonospora sp. NB11]
MTDLAPGALTTTVADALRAGTRAPSPHNTQPWLFEVRGNEIDVLLDERRVLAVSDPDGREAVLSCGAAVLNIRLELARHRTACAVSILPERTRPELLATVRVGLGRGPAAEDARLADAIGARHTNRRPFVDTPVPSVVRHGLLRAARAEGARLVLLTEPAAFDAFAALLRRADHVQRQDPAFLAELQAWSHHGERRDGVPLTAGGPRSLEGTALALREYVGAAGRVAREFERQPLVAVLTSPGDTRRDAVRAGQALQRVLLTVTAHGLQASFLAQPLEIPSTREELRTMLGGTDHPQAALRIGYGHPGAQTPRRELHEVVRGLDGER